MEPLRPVRWREGMFVRPHHFQQFDLYLEARQIAFFQSLVGNGWGLARMELAEDLLANYTFEVKSLRAIMPDGTLVDVPGNGRLPGRTLDPKQLDLGSPREVLLGVRRVEERRPRRSSRDPDGRDALPAGGTTRCSTSTWAASPPIERMEYDLQLSRLGADSGLRGAADRESFLTGNPSKPLVLTPGSRAR
jgi:hypothetical protein